MGVPSIAEAWRNVVELVAGDGERPDPKKSIKGPQMLADWLPYRSFDKEKEIFYQEQSKGFIVELAPLIGADDRVGEICHSLFADILLPGTIFSVTNWASPRITDIIDGWRQPRYRAGGVFRKLAKYRADLLRDGAWKSLASDGPFVVKNFRVVLAVGAHDDSGISISDLVTMRDGVIAALSSINVDCKIFAPTDLIRWIDDITCPSTGAGDDAAEYNPLDQINNQCVRRDLVTVIEKNRIRINAQSLRASGAMVDGVPEIVHLRPTKFDVRNMGVRQFPPRWAPWDTQKIIGDVFMPKLSLPCPVLTTLTGIIGDPEAASARAGYKFARTTSLADSKSARLLPNLKFQSKEWERVQALMREGQRLVQCYYSVSVISPHGEAERNERIVKSIYKAAGLRQAR